MTGSRARYLAELEATEVQKAWKLPLRRKPPVKAPAQSWTKPLSEADRRIQENLAMMRKELREHGNLDRYARIGLYNEENRDLIRQVGKPIEKRDSRPPLPQTLSTKESGLLVARHGLTGTLPSHLNRADRMKVYEARYNASGGRKGEKWGRRARNSDYVKTAGLAGATAAGGALLAARTHRGAKVLGGFKHAEKLKSHAETIGIGAATVGGVGELYGDAARRKQASYTSTPAGVAASALRRLHNYPGGPK